MYVFKRICTKQGFHIKLVEYHLQFLPCTGTKTLIQVMYLDLRSRNQGEGEKNRRADKKKVPLGNLIALSAAQKKFQRSVRSSARLNRGHSLCVCVRACVILHVHDSASVELSGVIVCSRFQDKECVEVWTCVFLRAESKAPSFRSRAREESHR